MSESLIDSRRGTQKEKSILKKKWDGTLEITKRRTGSRPPSDFDNRNMHAASRTHTGIHTTYRRKFTIHHITPIYIYNPPRYGEDPRRPHGRHRRSNDASPATRAASRHQHTSPTYIDIQLNILSMELRYALYPGGSRPWPDTIPHFPNFGFAQSDPRIMIFRGY